MPLRRPQPSIRTDEDTIALLHRLAEHHPDTKIAGLLNRQGRRTARGLSFTASRVQSLRHRHQDSLRPAGDQPREQEAELLTVSAAAKVLGITASTLGRVGQDRPRAAGATGLVIVRIIPATIPGIFTT